MTKIWILRPIKGRTEDDNPWDPWCDKAFGFVVRAETEADARQMAHDNAGDENRGEFMGEEIARTLAPWLDPKYSTCEPLLNEGEVELIMKDFAAA